MQTAPSQSPPPLESFSQEGISLRSLVEVQQLDPTAADLPLCWVEGEISDLSSPPSGHEYFNLNAGGVQIPCVLFASVSRRCSVQLRNGLLIAAYAQPQANPKDGGLELDVRDLRICGEQGPQQTSTATLRERLRAEGLFDATRKRPLPTPPSCLGIITSATSQVLHDIMHVLQRRAPALPTQFVAAATTGERAPTEIAAALRQISTYGVCDLVILARGGGSERELAAYNTEAVARAIAECAVPVISAVGHEPNVTLADLVADLRCATPSVAAERVATLVDGRSGFLSAAKMDPVLTLRTGEFLVTVQRTTSPTEGAS